MVKETVIIGGEEFEFKKLLLKRNKYLMIRDLCYILLDLLPNKTTRLEERYYEELLSGLSSREKGLVNLLTHLLTLLHSERRIYARGYYRSEEEDVYLALKLMSGHINPVGFMSSEMKQNYLRLVSYFGEEIFKAKEAEVVLGLKKTQTWKTLEKLSNQRLLYKHIRKGSKGYLYQRIKEVD